MNQQSHEEWLANREGRRHEHIEIDREEVWAYFRDVLKDSIEDGWGQTLSVGNAFEKTLDRFEEQGLTVELMQEILDDWYA